MVELRATALKVRLKLRGREVTLAKMLDLIWLVLMSSAEKGMLVVERVMGEERKLREVWIVRWQMNRRDR